MSRPKEKVNLTPPVPYMEKVRLVYLAPSMELALHYDDHSLVWIKLYGLAVFSDRTLRLFADIDRWSEDYSG